MSMHRVVEKRGRFYPEFYTPELETVFLWIFLYRREARWNPFYIQYDDHSEERSFSTKEQAVLWIKTGSPFHPDKTVWEE